jgi:hypothetical protein
VVLLENWPAKQIGNNRNLSVQAVQSPGSSPGFVQIVQDVTRYLPNRSNITAVV